MIYQAHIRRHIILHTSFILLSAIAIAWFQQLLKFGYLLSRGVSMTDLLYLSALVMPRILFIAAPIIIAIGVLMAYYDLVESRVLIIYRAIGMNHFSMSLPPLKFTLAAIVLMYGVSLYLLPVASSAFKNNLNYFKENFFFSVLEEKTFTPISGSVILYIGSKYDNNIIEDIIIFDNRDSQNKSIVIAELGKLSFTNSVPNFHLRKGARLAVPNKKGPAQISQDNSTLFFEELDISFKVAAPQVKARSKDIEEHHIHELLWPSSELPQSRQHKLKIEGHKRLVWPFYSFVIVSVMLSVFLQFRDNRTGVGIKKWIIVVCSLVTPCYSYFASVSFVLKHPDFIAVLYILPVLWLIGAFSLNKRSVL